MLVLSLIGATEEESDVPVIYFYDMGRQESRALDNTIGIFAVLDRCRNAGVHD